MKETMTKRFFAPIWKCEEIESKLEQLENEGWRLDKISGFRKFIFTRAKQKTVKYFFTYSLGYYYTRSFRKEFGMIKTEQELKSLFKANEIDGNFIGTLHITSIYRMTMPQDLLQVKISRNIYLRHMALQYILIELFITTIAVAGITLSCVYNKIPLFDIRNLCLAIIGSLGLFSALRNLFGLIYLRRQYRKYFKSKQNTASEE